MELRTVDPRKLKANPNNPRRTAASPQADAQMLASVQERGIIQPPLVRITGTTAKGADVLTIDAGHRRVAAAVKAGLKEMLVLVEDTTETTATNDPMNAIVENLVRAEMGPVDRWRAMESLAGAGWTDEAIAGALNLTARNIAQLRLLARICPPMLDRMAQGDMPRETELRTIASAGTDEQLSVWKANKPKRNERADWHGIAGALTKRTLRATAAKFGPDEAAAFGIVWTEDLFAPADEDSRTTTQVDAFMEAQQAWLEANLPGNGTIIGVDEWDRPLLPKGAMRLWGEPGENGKIGHYVDTRSGDIRTVVYAVPDRAPKADAEDGTGETPSQGCATGQHAASEVTVSGTGADRVRQVRLPSPYFSNPATRASRLPGRPSDRFSFPSCPRQMKVGVPRSWMALADVVFATSRASAAGSAGPANLSAPQAATISSGRRLSIALAAVVLRPWSS